MLMMSHQNPPLLYEQIMSDFQENPPTAQKHMQIPMIMKKYKIISAQDFQENPPNGSVFE